jgi:phosphoribosyl 1,2-cyclic phosphodiesterase
MVVHLYLPREEQRAAVVEEVVLLGTGTSSGVPYLACLAPGAPPCACCLDAADGRSRNRRGNPSALVRYRPGAPVPAHLVDPADGLCTVLIDCGKTFYASVVAEAARKGGRRPSPLAGVLLSHGHADAMLGVDDLRHYKPLQPTVSVWCDGATLRTLSSVFPYIVDTAKATGGGDVASVSFRTFVPWDPSGAAGRRTRRSPRTGPASHARAEDAAFVLPGGLHVVPVRVPHGTNADGTPYWANGFLFNGGRVVYVSDTTALDDGVLAALRGRGPTGLFVVDCCFRSGAYWSHACWPQVQPMVDALAPAATALVGMAHDIEYASFQREVDARYPRVSDGVVVRDTPADGGDEPTWHGRVHVGYDGLVFRL